MPTDFTWYEWEESAEVVSGKVQLALPAIGEEGDAKKYPSMPCVTSELIQHREKGRESCSILRRIGVQTGWSKRDVD